MPDRPTGTVTFLFSDIEGSTKLLQRLGDGYSAVLADHQRLLRAAWTAHSGEEIDTQGDSFFVVFARATDALAAAAQAQRALAAHTWPAGGVVRVRMGLHTGVGTLSGGHYVGLDVHRAARIAPAMAGRCCSRRPPATRWPRNWSREPGCGSWAATGSRTCRGARSSTSWCCRGCRPTIRRC